MNDNNKNNDEKRPLLQDETSFSRQIFSEKPTNISVLIDRNIVDQDTLNEENQYNKPRFEFKKRVKNFFHLNFTDILLTTFPILKWLPSYKWKQNFVYDLLSGMTIAVMHIPQGMAYSSLGNMPAITGIYMAFTPVLVYFVLGSSRHISIGTFAIICMLSGKAIEKLATDEFNTNSGSWVRQELAKGALHYHTVDVAVTLCLLTGLFQVLFYFLRAGVVSNLLSPAFVAGFTCASGCLVVVAQIKDLFGFPIPKHTGYFSAVKTIWDAVRSIKNSNQTAMAISLVVIVCSVINNEYIKPRLAKKTKVPFPCELVMVVLGTLISTFCHFHEKYSINIVGDIPTGFPPLTIPKLELFPLLWMDGLTIAIVSYSITISVAFIFSAKGNYKIDPNQELLALGAGSIAGAFSHCLPTSASLGRTTLQYNVGGKTQLASLVSCVLLLNVILYIGPCFKQLPKAVLSGIIVVALKGMLLQVRDLPKVMRMSYWDGLTWIISFIVTFVVRIDVGLLLGVGCSLLSLFLQGERRYICLLGNVPNTDLYLDLKRYQKVVEIDKIKIVHYSGSINFAKKTKFKESMMKVLGFYRKKIISLRHLTRAPVTDNDEPLTSRCVILDCSAIPYIDPSGVEQLKGVADSIEKLDIYFLLASVSAPLYETFEKCNKQLKTIDFMIFPTVHDAVLYAQNVLLRKESETSN